MKGVAITLVVVVVLATVQLMAKPSNAAINCSQVEGALSPCIQYLTQGGTPSDTCCSGVRNLQSEAQTKEDRQAACSCMKTAAASFQIRDDAAAELPQKCEVQINIPISRNTDWLIKVDDTRAWNKVGMLWLKLPP
ncbi:non-specific lipid-transfer protein 1-like [Camellia sinensis]|uniref:Non-specific lipid-transfer protein n=1 Tax=Camellia sinensis var. sinensis TaxID=542762 RepID=A0A4S4DQ27_CAMSN|nr:non-specific lipid-transfer protein 1-like [Camellia sinensis]THG05095.1 hypothetical protein TEA_012901 [Camellia sinensis var. sinensis]